jgi:hypothetical protein
MPVTAQLADGRTLQFPDGTDPSVVQATVKKVVSGGSVAPPAPTSPAPASATPKAGSPRLGPVASQAARPIAEGLAGIAGMVPDAATRIANLLPSSMAPYWDPKTGFHMSGEPQATLPTDAAQKIIDKFTTQPQTGLEKGAELVNSMLVGGMAGPKMPKTSTVGPIAQRLANEGVTTTPGMRAAERGTAVGRSLGALEEKAGAVLPPIKNARAKAVEQWNTARLNESLRSAGIQGSVPKGYTGRDAIKYTYQQLQDRYNDLYSRARLDLNQAPKLKQALQNARARFANARNPNDPNSRVLNEEQSHTLKDIIDNTMIRNFSRKGEMSGQKLKEIEETLRVEAEEHEKRGSYQDRQLAGVLRELRESFKQSVSDQNPKISKDLDAVDKGYAQYKLSERASVQSATKSGGYTPGQRLMAAKARDTSADKGRFARGEERGQTEAEEAQSVLGNTQPDSGTPFGSALVGAALGLGGGLTHLNPAVIAAAIGSPAVYSQPVLKLLQDRALSNDPELFSKLGALMGAHYPGSGTDQAGVAQ